MSFSFDWCQTDVKKFAKAENRENTEKRRGKIAFKMGYRESRRKYGRGVGVVISRVLESQKAFR